MSNKNLIIISIGQIFSFTSPVVAVLLGGIIGTQLIDNNYLVTLPTALMIVGTAAGSLFASKLMELRGRKFGFAFASILNSLSSIICAYGISIDSFILFSLGNLFIGLSASFAQQYRFAASESVSKNNIPKAISLILLLGIVAALVGSNIVSISKDIFLTKYVGSYISLSFLAIIPFFFFLFYKDDDQIKKENTIKQSTMKQILSNRNIQISIASAGVGYTVMSTLMTATPISMNIMHGFSIFSTGLVIQLHVVGMFLPSLITGSLVKKFGHQKLMYSGVFLLITCIFINYFFQKYYGYMIGLVLLGVGWNFLFVSGTSLLVLSYKKEDRYLAQGLNDFVVFSSQSIGSLSAGFLLYLIGWKILNLVCIPILLLFIIFSFKNFNNK
ncbi:MFS transporter [Alphaproteobacteria bacterium]|nr:MFS transporter [Alphaproteobacteria bacterium]